MERRRSVGKRRETEGIRRKTVVEGIQQRREKYELGRGDGRNKKEHGRGRREEDKLRRGEEGIRRKTVAEGIQQRREEDGKERRKE